MRCFLCFLIVGLSFAACTVGDEPGTGPSNYCGRGMSGSTASGVRLCGYSAALVIEGGFYCPSGCPFEKEFGDARVCAEQDIDPRDVPLDMCLAIGGPDCGMPDAGRPDGGRPDASMCVPDPPLAEIASVQTIRFEFSGPAGVYVASEGAECTPFTVGGQVLGTPTFCGCGCDNPSAPTATAGQEVSRRPVILWDGRSAATFLECVDCAMAGRPEFGIVPRTRSVPRPIPSGTYTAQFRVFDGVPAGCMSDPGAFRCEPAGMEFPGAELLLCPGDRTVDVTFTVVSGVDLVVPVAIPPA
ncbi:MAG: hypothetical protein AAGF12_09135 [Myxococcota bacterium]